MVLVCPGGCRWDVRVRSGRHQATIAQILVSFSGCELDMRGRSVKLQS
jgi:hypothetical protein